LRAVAVSSFEYPDDWIVGCGLRISCGLCHGLSRSDAVLVLRDSGQGLAGGGAFRLHRVLCGAGWRGLGRGAFRTSGRDAHRVFVSPFRVAMGSAFGEPLARPALDRPKPATRPAT